VGDQDGRRRKHEDGDDERFELLRAGLAESRVQDALDPFRAGYAHTDDGYLREAKHYEQHSERPERPEPHPSAAHKPRIASSFGRSVSQCSHESRQWEESRESRCEQGERCGTGEHCQGVSLVPKRVEKGVAPGLPERSIVGRTFAARDPRERRSRPADEERNAGLPSPQSEQRPWMATSTNVAPRLRENVSEMSAHGDNDWSASCNQ